MERFKNRCWFPKGIKLLVSKINYKPLQNVVNYLKDAYRCMDDISQKIGNSIFPSGLEHAVVGVPNGIPPRNSSHDGYYGNNTLHFSKKK